jgi:DNA-binding NarL/FixJ family response regulator
MAGPIRILMVADDAEAGRRLQELLETQPLAGAIEVEDGAAFEQRPTSKLARSFDLLIGLVDFSPESADESFAWIERALAPPGAPPLVVVAENGDELAATGTLHRGATDYLPSELLDPQMLSASLKLARKAGRAAASSTHTSQDPPIPPLPQRLPRDLIPRYVLLDTLGESMRATVYLAFSAALDRQVALKVSHISDDGEPQFAREFEAVGALRDPAVVDIYDYGVHEGREFIAMEYFPCGDLKARLLNPISMEESLRYLERIALALSVVHTRGLVHRDLKPPNIMLRESGEVVLIDFGIAKNLEHGAGNTRTGVLRGSPYYMSPEQAQGAELDARSDLYSLGVIFYEMLTGAKPYVAATAMEVLQQHVDHDIPDLAPEFARYQSLLAGLMAKDRNDRFASAHALLEKIHGVAA